MPPSFYNLILKAVSLIDSLPIRNFILVSCKVGDFVTLLTPLLNPVINATPLIMC